MINLTTYQKEVIRKILYAVETGGQVYGKQNYSAFIGANTNTSNEVAITIGAGQWYGAEAKTLLNLIRQTYSSKFNSLDICNIANDLDTKNWSKYNISVSSDKAKCIINIISSPEGIKCQDLLMEKQIVNYSIYIQNKYGAMSVDAIAECINISHQGGYGALQRILSKTRKPYTAKTIYDALCTDVNDKSNNNQVGDYVTRQKQVYKMINTYLISKPIGGNNIMTENELRNKVANWLVKYIGIKEGSSKHIEILNIFNNSKLCSRYKMTTKDAWCATAVSSSFIACGLTKIFPCVECSCYYMIELAKKVGIWVEDDAYTPKVGDVVMYYWKDSGYGDCTGVPDHVGIVISVNGNTIKVIEGNITDSVGYRNIPINGRYIRGYITPKYHTVSTPSGSTSKPNIPSTPTTPQPILKYKVGDVVDFNGSIHYGNANATSGYKCKSGKATITAISKNSKHLYHIIAVKGKGSNVYGWVNESDISKKVVSENSHNNDKVNTSVDYASSYAKSIAGTYTTTAVLHLRTGAGTNKASICLMPKGSVVKNYGYYSVCNGVKWYYVSYSANGKNYIGFCSSNYLR